MKKTKCYYPDCVTCSCETKDGAMRCALNEMPDSPRVFREGAMWIVCGLVIALAILAVALLVDFADRN